jgi:PAS domain S-box-containing protein
MAQRVTPSSDSSAILDPAGVPCPRGRCPRLPGLWGMSIWRVYGGIFAGIFAAVIGLICWMLADAGMLARAPAMQNAAGPLFAAPLFAAWWTKSLLAAAAAVVLIAIADVLIGVLLRQLRRAVQADDARLGGAIRFRTYFDQVADAILMLKIESDGQFVYEDVNRAAEAILGLPANAIIGRRPRQVWPPARAAFIEACLHRCVAEGCPITTARAVDLPDGPRRLSMTLALVHDEAGQLRNLVQSVLDVTEQSRLEEQLRHSQRMEAVGRLTAGVAHDFNNLLQAQMSSLELLMDEVMDSSAAREYAELSMRSAERGAQLTHHLLAFARKQVLQPKPVRLKPLLSDLAGVLRRTIGPHIDIGVACDDTVPAAYADPGQIELALVNLAVNAADAMPAGGQLRISATPAQGHDERHDGRSGGGPAGEAPEGDAPEGLARGDYVVLAVTDNGAGMPAETLAHACEPFFTTKGVNGSGLGLSMVQGFARQSGGDVRIISATGHGTRVEIWLPQAMEQVPAASPAPAPRRQGSGRVLLVDDAPDVLLTASVFLEDAGFDVVRAATSNHALVALAAGEHFDALVSDYAMPGLNGTDLILRALRLQPSLSALLITGFAEVAGIDTMPGQVQVLRKPFRREELVRRVKQLLEGRVSAQAVLPL